ncbi:MAG: hypothetical protein VCF25_30050 [Candidatus Poribacteria bacterium]
MKGETIKTYIDGKLQVETKDKTYKDGRPGLGGRDSTVSYDYVEINGPGIAAEDAILQEMKKSIIFSTLYIAL